MNYKGILYYIFIWLLPVLSAIYAFFVDSVGLGITLAGFSIFLIVYSYFYLKSIKIKIKGGFLEIKKGRIIKQSFFIPKSRIACIKTINYKIIRLQSLIVIAPNLKVYLPFLTKNQIKEILNWYEV